MTNESRIVVASASVKLLVIAGAIGLALSQSADAAALAKPGTLRRSVQIFFAANNTVQNAVDLAICKADSMIDKPMGAYGLRKSRDVKTANAILASLGDVYDKSAGTDSALEKINSDFCDAASNR